MDDALSEDVTPKAGKPEGPPLELLREVRELREAEQAAIAADPRPRILDVTCEQLGGPLRIRRWGDQQVAVIAQRLRKAGVTSLPVSVSDIDRGNLIKAIQIGAMRLDDTALAFPGEKGFNEIGRLPNAELERLANEALQFNEVLD